MLITEFASDQMMKIISIMRGLIKLNKSSEHGEYIVYKLGRVAVKARYIDSNVSLLTIHL